MDYPKWLYHAALEPTLVNTSEEELACLESGWADTPAAFDEPKPKAK